MSKASFDHPINGNLNPGIFFAMAWSSRDHVLASSADLGEKHIESGRKTAQERTFLTSNKILVTKREF